MHKLEILPGKDDIDVKNRLDAPSSIANDSLFRKYHNFYITVPWSPKFYLTVRGAENFHIYVWILKDFFWAQGCHQLGVGFGIAALAWIGVLFYHAIEVWNLEEIYMLVPQFLWLFGNFWWMYGELINNDDAINAPQAGHVFEAAFGILVLYHFVLRPLNYLEPSYTVKKLYNPTDLHPRFSYFRSWRQYEHAHTLFWLGKDWSWNQLNPYTWVLFLIPTVLIAVDFIWTTHKTRKMTIDTIHYIAQLMWVFANMIWAMGELFFVYDHPWYIFDFSYEASHTSRWYASWCLILALIPIVGLYILWLPMTILGTIPPVESKEVSYDYVDESVREVRSPMSSSTL